MSLLERREAPAIAPLTSVIALDSRPRAVRPAISFVLPAFNEEANIRAAILATVAAAERGCERFEVVVVDDGSSDRTGEVVAAVMQEHPQVRLIAHGTNRGYGEALRTGFEAAALDHVFFTDADNQFTMDELPRLLALADEADVVAGYRTVRHDPPLRLLNGWAWNRLVRLLFCVPVRDVDCAFKLFRRDVLRTCTIESRGAMVNTELMVKLARSGSRIVEVGVTHSPRTAGQPHGANPRVILRAFVELARMSRRLRQLDGSMATTPVAELAA